MAITIKNIPGFRIKECNRMKSERLDPHFIGSQFRVNGEEIFGFFERINGNSPSIENKLTTNLNMAQDTQAIFEFVQNAVDAGSSDFFMYYDDDQFIALNNGDSFDEEDILSILSVGASTKTSPKDEEMIGRFGVGFKLIHRMVGAQSGVDELINNYAGPIMFSWKNQQHLEELLQVNSSNDLRLGDSGLNGDDPWFFKFLLTCFPMLPQNIDTEVRNLSYKSVSPAEKPLFDEQELEQFTAFLNNFWIARYDELQKTNLSTGSIFYLKLGDGKKDKLDEDFEHYRMGLNYSLRFIETLREADGLKNIYFNRHDPITSDDVNLQVDLPVVIHHGSEDHKLVSPLLEERDRGIDIKFRFAFEAFQDDPDTEIGLISNEPNFFKYFPIGKEIHRLNFILHCNAFKIETSRREFQQDDQLNSKLLSIFSKHFIQRLSDYKEQNKQLYRDLFLSVLLSDDPGSHRDKVWLRDKLYKPLLEFCREYVPVYGGGYAPAKKVITKDSNLSVPESYLDKDIYWFRFDYKGEAQIKIVEQADSVLGIEIWQIADIIREMTFERFQLWYNEISNEEKSLLLEELKDQIRGTFGQSFWENVQIIDGIFDLIKNCDNESAKKQYLLNKKRIELRAQEIHSDNNNLINLIEFARQFSDDKEFLSKFRDQFVIIDNNGEEYPLTEVAKKDDVHFTISEKEVVLSLAEVLPESFEKTSGIFKPVYDAFKKLDVDVDTIFGIGSVRGKNLIKYEIENSDEKITAEQFVFLLMYSLESGTQHFKEVPQEIRKSTLHYLWERELFLPTEKYQQYITGRVLDLCIYPQEFALKEEKLSDYVQEWLDEDDSSKASKLKFLSKYGLRDYLHPVTALRRSLINGTADSGYLENVSQLSETDIKKLFRFIVERNLKLSGTASGVFRKITAQAKFFNIGYKNIPLPIITGLKNDSNTIIKPTYYSSYDSSNQLYKLDDQFIENIENPPCTIKEILDVFDDKRLALIDTRFTDVNFGAEIQSVAPHPANDLDKVDGSIRIIYRFIKEWQIATGYKLYLFNERVPRCIKFKEHTFKRYLGGAFHIDMDAKTVFIGNVGKTDEESLYNIIFDRFKNNQDGNHTLENLFVKLKKVDPDALRKNSSDSNYYKKLSKDSDFFTGEWLENIISWEKARKEETYYKSRKLRFNSITADNKGRITLSKYQYDTIPNFIEAYFKFDKITVFSDTTTDSISISAELLEVNDFEIQLQFQEGANLSELISYVANNRARAIITLPKEDIWLKQLQYLIFSEEVVVPEDYLPERVTNEWDEDDIRFIFGPPGTGKTTKSAILSLYELKDAFNRKEEIRILVLTPTNKAANVFIEKCLEIINDPDSILEYEVGLSDDEKLELFEFINKQDVSDWVYRFGKTGSYSFPLRNYGWVLPESRQSIVATTIHRYTFTQEIFQYNKSIENGSYRIIIDEASMVPQPYALYVLLTCDPNISDHDLSQSKLATITIAGDPFQIQPVGLSPNPAEVGAYNGWSTENLYTLLNLDKFDYQKTPVGNYKVDNLKIQFRSNEIIGKLFSDYCYQNLLEHYNKELSSELDDNFKHSIYYLKFDVHDFDNEQNPITRLYHYRTYPTYHIYSCVFAIELAAKIKSLTSEKLLILSPYGIQARILKDLIDSDQTRFDHGEISASTVHGAQGDQADHVILVQNPSKISNSRKTFFNNSNLINVAISRARKKLFVLAPDPALLSNVKELDREVLTFDHPVVTYGRYEFESEYFDSNYSIKLMIGVQHFSDFLVEDVATANFGDKTYNFYTGDGKVFCWFNSEKKK